MVGPEKLPHHPHSCPSQNPEAENITETFTGQVRFLCRNIPKATTRVCDARLEAIPESLNQPGCCSQATTRHSAGVKGSAMYTAGTT